MICDQLSNEYHAMASSMSFLNHLYVISETESMNMVLVSKIRITL